MGRTPGARNRVSGAGANGLQGDGRKTLMTNGKKGPSSGRSSLGSSNGVHSKMNGNAGVGAKNSHGPMQNLQHENSTDNMMTDSPVDYSNQVNFPYEVRLNGFSTLLETMKSATENVRKLVMDECDIIMECRICRNLFRSLPNYLKHKRSFCTEKFRKISPGGLSQLMQLAADSFKINGGTKLSFPPVHSTSLPSIASATSTGETGERPSNSTEQAPSFDLNHVIPMLTRATRDKANGLRVDESLNSQHEANTAELKLLDNTTAHYQGFSRHRKVDFQSYVSSIRAGAHAKRLMHDTVLIGPDAEIACAADPEVINDIIDRLLTKVEERHVEQGVKQQTLKCSTCHTWFDTEKSLRMHVRTHAVVPARTTKKRKSATPTVPVSTNTTAELKPVSGEVQIVVEKLPEFPKPKDKPTPMSSRSISAKPAASAESNVTSPMPVTPSSSTPSKPGKVQTNSKSKPELPPPLLFNNGSVPTKGRRTNNSFSATLNTASLGTLLPSLTPVTTPVAPPTPTRSRKRGNQQRFVSPASDSQKPAESKSSKIRSNSDSVDTSASVETFECHKCEALIGSKSEMSSHLAWCTGAINYSYSTSHGQSSTPKISILDRQEYYKPPSASKSPVKVSPSAVSNPIIKSEVVHFELKTESCTTSESGDTDKDTVSVSSISSYDQDSEEIKQEPESEQEEPESSIEYEDSESELQVPGVKAGNGDVVASIPSTSNCVGASSVTLVEDKQYTDKPPVLDVQESL